MRGACTSRRLTPVPAASSAGRTPWEATTPAIYSVGFGDRYTRWSPDGKQVLVPSGGSLFLVDAASGEVRRLPLGMRARYGRWSRDGKSLVYVNLSSDRLTTQIVSRDLETQQERVIYRSAPELARAHDNFHSLELSPDERWLAFGGAAATTDLDTRVMRQPCTGRCWDGSLARLTST